MNRKKNKQIQGWGINDVDYPVTKSEIVNGKQKITWCCSYYRKWSDMIQRCFSAKYQETHPTYEGCSICDCWQHLSSFTRWVDGQPNKDWMNCELDKDFLLERNKHYSPETVVFISKQTNGFINGRGNGRGDSLIGVCYCPEHKKKPYMSSCGNPFNGKQERMGRYQTELEAHKAWQAKKHEHACKLADLQPDERVAVRLRQIYAPEKDWTTA